MNEFIELFNEKYPNLLVDKIVDEGDSCLIITKSSIGSANPPFEINKKTKEIKVLSFSDMLKRG